MDVHIPTTEEIHMIAFVTCKGWTYSKYENQWTKPGQTHACQKSTAHCCDGHPREEQTDQFSLDEAYEREMYP